MPSLPDITVHMVTILYVYRASSFKGKEEGNEELKSKMEEEKTDVKKVVFSCFPVTFLCRISETIEMCMSGLLLGL